MMLGHCEQLNALVYELYLPEDLHPANLPQADRTPRDPAVLRRKFEELYAPSHPLRAALQKLNTLDPVRIIEGKA